VNLSPSLRAASVGDFPAVREIFTEYARSLGYHICFASFQSELEGLPGDYAPPRGGLWLVRAGNEVAGCVALRPVTPTIGEIKRLYVRPAFRGHQLGRLLVEAGIGAARTQAYDSLQLDTLPTMTAAIRLYQAMGFRPVATDTVRETDAPLLMQLLLRGRS